VTFELVFAVATAPLGEEEGYIAISIVKALHRLKMSGAAWHEFWCTSLTAHLKGVFKEHRGERREAHLKGCNDTDCSLLVGIPQGSSNHDDHTY
jgi:hypothetical protein